MRLVPGKTKVGTELFKGVKIADMVISAVALILIILVLTSNLPGKLYFTLGIAFLAAVLLVRLDSSDPNYVYFLHIFRYLIFDKFYKRRLSEEDIMMKNMSEEEKQEYILSRNVKNVEDEIQETKEDIKKKKEALKQEIKEENRILKSKTATEEEKDAVWLKRANRSKEKKEASKAKKNGNSGKSAKKGKDIKDIVAFTGIKDSMIEYGGKYYGMVMEIPPVEFRFFSKYRRQNSIENSLGKVLRSINNDYAVNIVKLDRPIRYESYLDKEYAKLDSLKQSFESGMLREDELKSRVEIVYDRVYELQDLCEENKVISGFYYLVLFDTDRKQLRNSVSVALDDLSNGEMKPRVLNNRELAMFLRYSNQLDFEELDVDKISSEDYVDWASPESIRFTPRTCRINNVVSYTFRIANYPMVVGDAWLAGVMSMPGTKVVIKAKNMDRDKSIKNIDYSLQELRSQYRATSVDSRRLELENHIETLSELLSMLQGDNENLLSVNVYITAYDILRSEDFKKGISENSALPNIKNVKRTIRRLYQESNLKLNNLEFEQLEGFIASQISGYDPFEKTGRGMPSNTIAAMYPWIYAFVEDENGIKLGSSEGVPVMIDFFKRDSERVNSNMVIVGKSGSGKSYATKSLLTNLAADDSKIFILDPENEYSELAKNLNGKFINVGNALQGRLNPFHIITALDDDEAGAEGDVGGSYATHLQFLEEFFRQIIPDCDKDALEYLNSIIDRMYSNFGITAETDLSALSPEDYPVFDDLYDCILQEFQQNDNEYIRRMLRTLINYVSKFSAGGRNANIWNGPSTITTDENFTVFNFQSLLANRNGSIANAQMLLVLKYIDNEIIKNRDYNIKYGLSRKIIVVIDEAHVFIDTKFPVALDFMFQLAKRIRKYNGMQIVITQNIKDFVGSEEIARKSTAIINACQYSFIFSLAPNDMDDLCKLYEKAGGINEAEQERIVTAPRGQAFTIMSPQSRSTFKVEVPENVVDMFQNQDFKSKYFVGKQGDINWKDFLGEAAEVRERNIEKEIRDNENRRQENKRSEKAGFSFIEMTEEEAEEYRLNKNPKDNREKNSLKSEFEGISFDTLDEFYPENDRNKAAFDEDINVNEGSFEKDVTQSSASPSVLPQIQVVQQSSSKTEELLANLVEKLSYENMLSEIRRTVKNELSSMDIKSANAEEEKFVAKDNAGSRYENESPADNESFSLGSIFDNVGDEKTSSNNFETENSDSESDDSLESIFADIFGGSSDDKVKTETPESTDEIDEDGFADIFDILQKESEAIGKMSVIDMMEDYGDTVIDISLEELSKYIANH